MHSHDYNQIIYRMILCSVHSKYQHLILIRYITDTGKFCHLVKIVMACLFQSIVFSPLYLINILWGDNSGG